MTKKEEGFLPEGYKEPEGNYMKLQDGENTFRILSSAVVGYEYWNTENKPVRAEERWTTTPEDIKLDNGGKATSIKHFWVFVVWNNSAEKVQVLEITQKSIQSSIKAYVANEKWGDPKGYDLTVTKSGSGLDTEYVTMANPHSDAPTADYNINLQAIFDADGDMFAGGEEEKKADEVMESVE